jgi:hypothetical protein
MQQGRELAKAIQKRSRIQPGMLVKSSGGSPVSKIALVVSLSAGCKFSQDYEGAEEHIFYKCEPLDGTPPFVDYVCNMERVS